MQLTKIHIILFLITVATTFLAGFLQGGNVASGVSFSAALLFILGAHEMGHYVYGRKYGVDITAPYFIPAPPILSPIGTFGAFIKIKSPISSKRALFDIGIAGPLVGIIAAIPVIMIGVRLSTVVETSSRDIQGGIALGTPLIFSFLSDVVVGKIPEGYDILLHPVAFAGWIGLFVTALNLIPSGQLDGGHIMYSLLSRKWYRRTSLLMIFVLFTLGMGTRPIIDLLHFLWEGTAFGSYEDTLIFEGWPGWFLWAVILSVMSPRHPPTMDDELSLDAKRKLLGVIALLVFAGCFTPVPISIY
ncbi:MAG TPA: site-2 protease family protein [Thermodesulfobacteriota bacterium]|nr:site-2 protease family protein [Thermodesulfobacteriota bacterium]